MASVKGTRKGAEEEEGVNCARDTPESVDVSLHAKITADNNGN